LINGDVDVINYVDFQDEDTRNGRRNRSREEILDRISGFSGLTVFYLKDRD
jgi:hypothetical protein